MTKASIRLVAEANDGCARPAPILHRASSARVAGLLFAVASALCCGGREADVIQDTGGRTAMGSGPPTVGSSAAIQGGTNAIGGATALGGTGNVLTSAGVSASTGGSAIVSTGVSASAGGSAMNPAAGSPSLAGSASTPNRMTQLRGQPAWSTLKALWRRLDEVQPTTSTYSPYASTITAEQRDQWIAELAAALGAVQATGVLTETELLFLREIATARIEVMRDGGYHYEMFLHRAPELFEAQTENSIVRIEQKLDALEALRAKCRIDAEPYRQALEQVEREGTVFFIMDQLMLSYGATRITLTLPTDLWGEALAKELDQRFAALEIDPSTTEAQKTTIGPLRARLDAIQSTLVTLPALLQELERCE